MRQLVPHFILDKYKAGGQRGSFRAAGLFVDLSGFSRMTDALTEHGQSGAEALASVMKSIFQPLVANVYAQGGFIVGYAGDAFTAVFPNGRSQKSVLMCALSAVTSMQQYIRANPNVHTPFGDFPIFIKAGLGFGDVTWQIFKSKDECRATYCFRGDCVTRSVQAEEYAKPGEILIDSITFDLLQEFVDAEQVTDHCYRLLKTNMNLPAPRSYLEPEPDPDLVKVFCSEAILNMPFVGEFRQVVNLFLDIPAGITDELLVAPFMQTIFELQDRYGGCFLRPDLGDKGFNLLLFWGAPTAHETDIDRALNFVLDFSARTRLSIRAGVSYRTAYAGFIGVPLREDYTAYGWGVTLAARLMDAAADDEVWMDEEVARRAEKHFDIRYLEEFEFKGFAHKHKAYGLVGRKLLSDTVYHGELVGRRVELSALAKFVEPLRQGKYAGTLVVSGESGIGKSRLLHSFQTSRFFDEVPAQWAICQCDEIFRQSFSPFRDWLRKRFMIVDGQPDEINLQNFTSLLRRLIERTPDADLSAELTRTSSFLSALINLDQPGSLYDQLDAKGRYENTFIALSALFRAESLQKPLVLLIEDLHWLDEDTRAFLSYFVRALLAESQKNYPIVILASQRPEGDFLKWSDNTTIEFLNLERLPSSSILQLAENILNAPVHPSLLELLEQRADGNPFFAEQILHYLVESNMLLRREDGRYYAIARAGTSLPTDVRAVLTSRLDRLTQEVKETVQTASVLGREFEVRLLSSMLHDDVNLTQKIARAEEADIWFPLDEFQYMFRHVLLRDAAYTMQMHARRQELHAVAVRAMENLYSNEMEHHYAELAYHSEYADLPEKARRYYILAAKVSADMYQNTQAIDYYTRALAFIPLEDFVSRFDLLAERASLFNRVGNRASQFEDINLLASFASQLEEAKYLARVEIMYVYYYIALADYPSVIDHSKRALDFNKNVHDLQIDIDAFAIWSMALLRLGRLDEAMERAKSALQLARDSGRRLDEGRMLSAMGLIALEQKEPSHAHNYLTDAVRIAREIRNPELEGKALNNLAMSASVVQGDFASARDYYEQAYIIMRERGDRYGETIGLGNLGYTAGMMGDFGAARTYLKQALSISREVGSVYQETYALINLAAVTGVQNEAQASLEYSQSALELCVKAGDRSGEAWSCLYLGYAFFMLNDFEHAGNFFSRSIQIREELGQEVLAAEPLAGLIQVAMAQDDDSTAMQTTEKIFAHFADGGNLEGTEEPLRVYYACYLALEKMKDPRSHNILQSAVQLLEAQVSKLRDEQSRRFYVENVPWRSAIQQNWRKINS